jgi:hypothetical protein
VQRLFRDVPAVGGASAGAAVGAAEIDALLRDAAQPSPLPANVPFLLSSPPVEAARRRATVAFREPEADADADAGADAGADAAPAGSSGASAATAATPVAGGVRRSLDNGWRKVGVKRVKLADGEPSLRSYYKCAAQGCPARMVTDEGAGAGVVTGAHSCGLKSLPCTPGAALGGQPARLPVTPATL